MANLLTQIGVFLVVIESVISIYNPSEFDQNPRQYTTGLKIKSSFYNALRQPYYHSNYSKVYVHNKNYTSSLLDGANDFTESNSQRTKLYPVYISDAKKEKIENVLEEHNTNVVDKDTLNNRVVFKRRIEKSKNIEVYNKCPQNSTGQYVYDSSCNQYLDCWKGRGGPRNCAPGTLFNPKTLECDFPEKVECLTGLSALSLTAEKTARYQNYEQAKCPEEFSGLIPNYTDCSKFIQCNSGIQNKGTCPPGTLFDIKLNVCNHPRETTCFSGELGENYVLKEEYGSSTGAGEQYVGQNGQNKVHSGQYAPGGYYSGQNEGQRGQFSGQNNYLAQGATYGGSQNLGGISCDPTSSSCKTQGSYTSGQVFHSSPSISNGGPTVLPTGSNSNFGQGSRYFGGSFQSNDCNPLIQICQPSTGSFHLQGSFIPADSDVRQPQNGDVVYIQYVMCNLIANDCSSFQQGTFMLGPGGALCNPMQQQCQPVMYIPSSKMAEPNSNGAPPSSGVYYVKYVMCNPLQEDCSTYQRGIVEATYGVPGTLIGAKPVEDLPVAAQKPVECDPRFYNCAIVQSQGQVSTRDQISGSQGRGCNSQFENCQQQEADVSKTGSYGRYPKKFDSTSSVYGKNCGSSNCYQTSPESKSANREAKCPDGYQGLMEHPSSCKKFLNCGNGQTYVQDCAPGTLFNPFIKACDFSYNVDCKQDPDETVTTTQLPGINEHYGQSQDNGPPIYTQTKCQGAQCNQGQGNKLQGHYTGDYGQNNCQGSQCGQTQFSQGKPLYPGQLGQGYIQSGCQGVQCINGGQLKPSGGSSSGYYDGQLGLSHSACSGLNCLNKPQSQTSQGGNRGQMGTNYGNTQSQGGCEGFGCQTYSGYTTPSSKGILSYQGEAVGSFQSTTQRSYLPPPTQGYVSPDQGYQAQGGRSDQQSHVMKIPSKKDYQQVTPINKFDRKTFAGFNNQKSIDYVDIFDPDETRNYAYATTTLKPPQKQVWPPPYPDFVTTDPDADYVFEYENGEPVTLAPETVNMEKRKKTRCDSNDFVCDKKSCVAKHFVCDGVRDCDDGKDEKYCQKYMDEFKPYKNSRLDVLEKQRWDNVTYATCALLCMDSRKFECKSFNYRKIDRACFLTNENIGTSGSLKKYYPCDYYERKGTSLDCSDMHKCPSGKCLKSEQICDGYDDCGDRADERDCRAEDFGYEVKLAGGLEENEGRVVVTVFGKDGFVCDDQFDLTDADVLCKELGFHLGAAEVKGNSYFARDLKENHTLYMMDDIECLGNETSLMECKFAGWGIHNCADREIAGVICRTPQETCAEGFWKCDSGNECVKIPFLCDDLNDCSDNSDEASHHCDSPTDIRLVNGTRENEGRLEIRHHGIWGSICDDDFNEDAAKIVCQYLGFVGSASVKKDAYFGQSTGPIWLDQVSCFGNETSLENCARWEWGEHNCDHSEDVGVVCSNEIMEIEAQRSSKSFDGSIKSSIKNLDTAHLSAEPTTCGLRKDNIFLAGDDVHFRVVQGSAAKPGDYPWQAALRIKGQEKTAHWCGAVVVSSTWVLTAAHCLAGYSKGAYVVVAGEYDMDEDEGTEQQAFIEEYYLHDQFRQGHKMGNDIAMIRLKGSGFKLNQDIQPICLPDADTDYERELNCTISGFGTIQTGKSAPSHKLRAAWIPVQKLDVCRMAHIYGDAIKDGMICAGYLNGGVDACDGDSGGPLACLDNGLFTLFGITSWGQRCGYANKPGVYVKVSHYKKWIEKIMADHS